MTRIEGGSRLDTAPMRQRSKALPSSPVELVVMAAVSFNAAMALVNAHVTTLTPASVIACEALVIGSALALGLMGTRSPNKTTWLALILIILGFGLANGFGTGAFDAKFIRDAALIPVFVLLGLNADRHDVVRIVLRLQIVVLVVLVFEGLQPTGYGQLFKVESYYINTRGFAQSAFWSANSDLFVSATRPGDRFLFSGLGIHRLSSIFLEPVSLGNYCVLVALVVAASWSVLKAWQRLFFCASTLLILIGCDGRFATVSIVLIVVLRGLGRLLPRYLNWLYLPAVVGLAASVIGLMKRAPVGDDFRGRTAGSIHMLASMSGADLLGYSIFFAYRVMDSGIAYLVYSQSLLGALVIWSFIALGFKPFDRPSSFMIHGICLYVALNLLVSYSMFSIKTAALCWFSYGAFMRPRLFVDAAGVRMRRRPSSHGAATNRLAA